MGNRRRPQIRQLSEGNEFVSNEQQTCGTCATILEKVLEQAGRAPANAV
jgi:hypothetical protein